MAHCWWDFSRVCVWLMDVFLSVDDLVLIAKGARHNCRPIYRKGLNALFQISSFELNTLKYAAVCARIAVHEKILDGFIKRSIFFLTNISEFAETRLGASAREQRRQSGQQLWLGDQHEQRRCHRSVDWRQ